MLGDFAAEGGAFDYHRFTGLRGRAGLRGGRLTEVAFYVDGAAVKEFEGRDGLRFASGGQVVDIRAVRLGTYGRGALGMNVTVASGVGGFVEAHGEVERELRGLSIHAGRALVTVYKPRGGTFAGLALDDAMRRCDAAP